MKTAREIANYFLLLSDPDIGDSISNLKLQKLLYYAQGFNLVINGEPLFQEEIVSWEHGPVVSEIYYEYSKYGGGAIPLPENIDFESFTEDEKDLLNEVYKVYGQFSAWKLRDMTHQELPWKSTKRNEVISHDLLIEYFKEQIN